MARTNMVRSLPPPPRSRDGPDTTSRSGPRPTSCIATQLVTMRAVSCRAHTATCRGGARADVASTRTVVKRNCGYSKGRLYNYKTNPWG